MSDDACMVGNYVDRQRVDRSDVPTPPDSVMLSSRSLDVMMCIEFPATVDSYPDLRSRRQHFQPLRGSDIKSINHYLIGSCKQLHSFPICAQSFYLISSSLILIN